MPRPDGKPTEAEAIRQVIAEGARGDYTDIATSVKDRFGLLVGSRLVEEVVVAMRQEEDQRQQPSAASGDNTEGSAPPGDVHNRVLAFVQDMGGFDQARAAIDDLESTMRRLLN